MIILLCSQAKLFNLSKWSKRYLRNFASGAHLQVLFQQTCLQNKAYPRWLLKHQTLFFCDLTRAWLRSCFIYSPAGWADLLGESPDIIRLPIHSHLCTCACLAYRARTNREVMWHFHVLYLRAAWTLNVIILQEKLLTQCFDAWEILSGLLKHILYCTRISGQRCRILKTLFRTFRIKYGIF
jgi:hypothetical protein